MLEVGTGSRLHFGLMELCADQPLRYGGLGLMIADPPLTFRLSGRPTRQRPRTALQGEQARKIFEIIERRRRLKPDSVFPAEIRLQHNLPLHHGLGCGTQQACALALGLELFDQHHQQRSSWAPHSWHPVTSAIDRYHSSHHGQPTASQPGLQWLVQYSGRGLRSAIGLQGFLSGGLILDHGVQPRSHDRSKLATSGNKAFGSEQPATTSSSMHSMTPPGVGHHQQSVTHETPTDRTQAGGEAVTETLGTPKSGEASRSVTAESKSLASDWRVITIRPQTNRLICGEAESQMLETVGSRGNPRREQMFELGQRIFAGCNQPAGFNDFVEGLESYLLYAGEMFEGPQGGLYNGPDVTAVVKCARASGLSAVGQSSWGPTIFGFCRSQAEADQAVRQIQEACPVSLAHLSVAMPLAHRARFRWCD